MKTVLDTTAREELTRRIHQLSEHNVAQWGKMNVRQMLQHCVLWEEMALGRMPVKRSFIGRIFGRVALRDLTKSDAPLRKNTPTSPELKITTEVNSDFEQTKERWIALIAEHDSPNTTGIMHPFFGEMSPGQIVLLSYKHADHHLRQFGC
ncbi:DUF1569 domain-containing protein [Chitinophaga sp. 212800010-3]|uniref:DUF1569 domain-containing protein n=1 Tax=unclassified Chitinophaga TaxID=2619133 RepID=UPI002DE688FA|nr:DUF1569 domain-containing protein [Chitinophaga sp. 212800010-3]